MSSADDSEDPRDRFLRQLNEEVASDRKFRARLEFQRWRYQNGELNDELPNVVPLTQEEQGRLAYIIEVIRYAFKDEPDDQC